MVQPIADAISGIRWFHSGGIFAALSETIPALIIEGMQAAKSSGAVVSFDLNFREKLWKLSVGEERARAVIRRIVSKVDVLVGNDDIQWGLGIRGLEVTGKLKLDPTPFVGMISTVVARHPHIKIIATTLSDVRSTNRHAWAAVAWINGEFTCLRNSSSMSTTVWVVAMALRQDSSTVFSTVSLRNRR